MVDWAHGGGGLLGAFLLQMPCIYLKAATTGMSVSRKGLFPNLKLSSCAHRASTHLLKKDRKHTSHWRLSLPDGRQPQATYCTNSAGKTTAFPRNSDEHPALNGETEITPSARLTD